MPCSLPVPIQDDAAALCLRVAELEAERDALRGLLAQAGLDAADAAAGHAREAAAGNAALRASEARLRQVLESATEFAIVTTDLIGAITGWNRGAENVLGWDEAEALGQSANIFFTPEDRKADVPEAEMKTALAVGHAADERWHLKRDGTRFWANGSMMPLRDPGGVAVGLLKILHDRTGQRLAEERLREAAAEKALLVEEAHHG